MRFVFYFIYLIVFCLLELLNKYLFGLVVWFLDFYKIKLKYNIFFIVNINGKFKFINCLIE